MKYQNLFTPVKIGSVTIKNRFAMAPMGPLGLADSEGGFNQRGIDYYTERAKGGTGLIITGVTFSDCKVETQSMPNCPNSTYNPVHFIRTSREMTERVHAYGSKIFLMMSAGFGRVTIPTNLGEFPPVAPSAIPHRWLDKICRPLTVEEIRSIVKSFGDGAYNAKRAGFDGVEIHAVHEGYLLDQFAISMFNLRTDEYGGSLENRLRFAREVVEEIKSRCGSDFPVVMRFSVKSMIKDWREGALPGEEFEEKGRDIAEGLEAAKLLVQYGYDALDTDVGTYDAWWWNHPPMYQEKGLYRPYCKMVKEVVDVPVRRPYGQPGYGFPGTGERRVRHHQPGPSPAGGSGLREQAAVRPSGSDPSLHFLSGRLYGPYSGVFHDQLRCQSPGSQRAGYGL